MLAVMDAPCLCGVWCARSLSNGRKRCRGCSGDGDIAIAARIARSGHETAGRIDGDGLHAADTHRPGATRLDLVPTLSKGLEHRLVHARLRLNAATVPEAGARRLDGVL